MKKLITILITMSLLIAHVNAQEKEPLSDEATNIVTMLCDNVLTETGGFIDSEFTKSEVDLYSITIRLPSFYDFELAQMQVNSELKKYSDIKIENNWIRIEERYDIYFKVLDVKYTIFAIMYSSRGNSLTFITATY